MRSSTKRFLKGGVGGVAFLFLCVSTMLIVTISDAYGQFRTTAFAVPFTMLMPASTFNLLKEVDRIERGIAAGDERFAQCNNDPDACDVPNVRHAIAIALDTILWFCIGGLAAVGIARWKKRS